MSTTDTDNEIHPTLVVASNDLESCSTMLLDEDVNLNEFVVFDKTSLRLVSEPLNISIEKYLKCKIIMFLSASATPAVPSAAALPHSADWAAGGSQDEGQRV